MQEQLRLTVPSELELITSLGKVLVCLINQDEITLKQIAEITQLTERTVLKKISILENTGLIKHTRRVRQKYYSVINDEVRETLARQIASFAPTPEP